MMLPGPAVFLLRILLPRDRVDDALGDLEEVHRLRLRTLGRTRATALTMLEALDLVSSATLARLRLPRAVPLSWIDFRLGVRMLVKYPGLTAVGGLAMAFGLFVGIACFEFYSQVLHPDLPFDQGERVVMIDLLDDRSQAREDRILYDFATWAEDLSTVEDVGAVQSLVMNLAVQNEPGEPILAAAMTGAVFPMTRVAPLLGRVLVADDASATAAPVVIVSHETWQTRLGGDPEVVGRAVLVGSREHTIAGVMPPGFGFPVYHDLWLPLQVDASLEPLNGPGVTVVGRLAPGMTLAQAQSELTAHIARLRTDYPAEYEHLHPRVLPYAEAALGITAVADRLAVLSLNVFAGLFLVLVCGNVALLTFARAATREGEIVVRTALGASRARIVGQLFSEAFVLSAIACLLGGGAASWGLARVAGALTGDSPLAFWFHTSLSPRTIAYASALTVFAALVASVGPGLRITSGGVGSRLRSATSGGGGLRLGGLWTAVIVLQVAVTVTFPVVGWFVSRDAARIETYEYAFASGEYLSAGLRLAPTVGPSLAPADASSLAPGGSSDGSDGPAQPSSGERLGRAIRALEQRLESDPAIEAVTLAHASPGTSRPWRRIEMNEGGEAPTNELDDKGVGRRVSGGLVAADFFDVLEIDATLGRTFNVDDTTPDARTVVVNEPFVEEVLGGRNALGRQLRYLASADGWDGIAAGDDPGPWYRIVGVVPELGRSRVTASGAPRAQLYHAVSPESMRARTLIVRAGDDVDNRATRLREITREVEPAMALVNVQTLDAAKARELTSYRFWVRMIVVLSGIAMLLSLAGIYSVMSFTVERRTREIGVRVALGAGPARVSAAVFRRPLLQVAGGLVAGLALSTALGGGVGGDPHWGKRLALLLSYGALMTTVCSLACIVPIRRALRVEPSEALASDG